MSEANEAGGPRVMVDGTIPTWLRPIVLSVLRAAPHEAFTHAELSAYVLRTRADAPHWRELEEALSVVLTHLIDEGLATFGPLVDGAERPGPGAYRIAQTDVPGERATPSREALILERLQRRAQDLIDNALAVLETHERDPYRAQLELAAGFAIKREIKMIVADLDRDANTEDA